MPLVASSATAATPNELRCTSFFFPDCNKASCHVLANDDTLTFELLPCRNPPRVRLTNIDSSGISVFNQSFDTSTENVVATIGGTVSVLNISVVQHPGHHTVGLKVRLKAHLR